jgi:hypothetical protein
MYVLVDYHPNTLEWTSHSARDFINEWKWVWSSIVGMNNYHSHLKGRLFVDILNEPDFQGQRWEAQNGKAGITELYLGVMDALSAIDPEVGAWCLAPGAWCLVPGAWCLVPGAWMLGAA